MEDTAQEFNMAGAMCRDIFEKKLLDYGSSWRLMRPESLTDQIYIKAARIRSLETKGEHRIEEGVVPEWIGIVNYGVIALIQLEKGWADTADLSVEEALALYDRHLKSAFSLMLDKNHDYDEAWRKMRVSSFTDIILQKLWRTKQIEDNRGTTLISEGLDANYKDMINYAAFALIKLTGKK